jgi:hypothetical protein
MELNKSSAERDPHLPPPEVCDWLIEQQWSGSIPETVINYPKGNPEAIRVFVLFDFTSAYAAIGADEIVCIFLPVEALEALREDQAARATALEKKRAAPEDPVQETDAAPVPPENPVDDDAEPGLDALNELTGRLLNVIRDADAPIPVSIAALEAAKALFLSQVYDLRPRPEE